MPGNVNYAEPDLKKYAGLAEGVAAQIPDGVTLYVTNIEHEHAIQLAIKLSMRYRVSEPMLQDLVEVKITGGAKFANIVAEQLRAEVFRLLLQWAPPDDQPVGSDPDFWRRQAAYFQGLYNEELRKRFNDESASQLEAGSQRFYIAGPGVEPHRPPARRRKQKGAQ